MSAEDEFQPGLVVVAAKPKRSGSGGRKRRLAHNRRLRGALAGNVRVLLIHQLARIEMQIHALMQEHQMVSERLMQEFKT